MEKTVREQLNEIGGIGDFETVAVQIIDIALDVLLKKRAKRGTANIEEQGLYGVAMRLASDKMARIKHVSTRITFERWCRERMGRVAPHLEVQDEELADLEDDLIDVINYAVIMLALQRGWWGLPTIEPTEEPGKRQDFNLR